MRWQKPRTAIAFAAAVVLGAALAGCPETINFNDGRYYACSRDSGVASPCASGWRCGLEGFCHPADGGSWQCADDLDCDLPWRCGAEKRCVDPSADGLDARAWPSPTPQLLSPLYSVQPIESVAASGKGMFIDRCTDSPTNTFCPPPPYELDENISFVSGGQVVQALRLQNIVFFGFGFEEHRFIDGGAYPSHVATIAAAPDAGIAAVAASGMTTFALTKSSQMFALRGSVDGGTGTLVPVPLFTLPGPFAPNALATETAREPGIEPILVSYERDGTRLAVFSLVDGGNSGVQGPPSKIAGDPIRKIETFDSSPYFWGSLLAVTDAGVYSALREDVGFSQNDGGYLDLKPVFLRVSIGYDGGTQWVTPQAIGRRVVDVWWREFYLVLETVEGAGANAIQRLGLHSWGLDDSSRSTDAIHIEPPYDEVACDPGDVVSVADARFDINFNKVTLTAVCQHANPDGTTTESARRAVIDTFTMNTCLYSYTEAECRAANVVKSSVPNTGIKSLALTGPNRSGFADIHGRVFTNGDGDRVNPLTLPTVPSSVIGRQGTIEAWFDSTHVPGSRTDHHRVGQIGFAQTLNAEWTEPQKFPVRGNSKWRVEMSQLEGPIVTRPKPDGGWQTAFTMPLIQDLRLGPWEGQYFNMLGQVGMAVAAFDTVLSGVVGVDSLLQVRVVPNPRAPVTSFNFRETLDAGTIVDGYMASQGRLFRVTAETPVRWVSSEVELAAQFATPVFVWQDGLKGRVALSDGRVYALPSRVPVARPLPEPAPDTTKFAFVCGHAFALGRQHLYRLDTSSGPLVADWVPIPEAEALVPGAAIDPGWAGGKFHVVDEAAEQSLYVFNQYGTAIRLNFPSCP